jgi:hypothetical protein
MTGHGVVKLPRDEIAKEIRNLAKVLRANKIAELEIHHTSHSVHGKNAKVILEEYLKNSEIE